LPNHGQFYLAAGKVARTSATPKFWSYLSAIEHGRNEVVAEVLLAIGREFDKSLGWLLTGEK
jgi:hypothetical protein